jgi:hypothetical protein
VLNVPVRVDTRIKCTLNNCGTILFTARGIHNDEERWDVKMWRSTGSSGGDILLDG